MAAEYSVDGIRYLLPQIQGKIYQIKVVCNEHGSIFFPVTFQHADRCAEGIAYREGSKGNALAGMVYSDHLELRRHASFPTARVRLVIGKLLASLTAGMEPAVIERLGSYVVTYGAENLGNVSALREPGDIT